VSHRVGAQATAPLPVGDTHTHTHTHTHTVYLTDGRGGMTHSLEQSKAR
jgi:hypothetical protein